MTDTTIINAQSIGGSAAAPTQETKLTLQSTTAALAINVLLATGTAMADESSVVELCYASSPHSITAGAAPTSFKNAYDTLLIVPPRNGREQILSTGVFTANGVYLYVWLNVPALQSARTITVITSEL